MPPEDFKLALDDVRARHAALVNLILFTDQKAMGVFRLYATLGIAAGAAFTASFFRDDPLLTFSRWSMVLTSAWLAVAAFFCFRAMSRGSINLPGRGPEFWVWAVDERVTTKAAVEEYLRELGERQSLNRRLNENTALYLDVAITMGIATPLVVAMPIGLEYLWRTYFICT